MRRCIVLFFVTLTFFFVGVDLSARSVEGRVTCGKKTLSNVLISDGYSFTRTDRKGEFKFELADSAEFVYIVTPSGYAADWSSGVPQFYQTIDERTFYTFNLIKIGNPTPLYNIIADRKSVV